MAVTTGKSFWESKTFWVNILGAGAMFVQSQFGFVFDPNEQAIVLCLVNMGLRTITKDPIVW